MTKTAKRIDGHTHIIPPEMPDFHCLFGGESWPSITRLDDFTANIMVRGKVFRKIGKDSWDAKERLKYMDHHGIEMQVLSPIPITLCYWAPIKGAVEMARLQNDYIANVVKQYPNRFIGLGTVPMQDIEEAIIEMDRCIHKLGLKGLEIGTNVNGVNLDDPEFIPFFEMAERWNVPLLIHPYHMVGADRSGRYNLSYTVAMPSELAFTAASLLCSGVFDRFPQIKICLAHGGGSLPFILPRLDKGWEAWPALRKTEMPPSFYANRFYYDALVYDARNIEYLVDLFGHQQLLMGTDYPFPIMETPPGKAVLEAVGLHQEQIKAIMGENTLRFFQIE